MEELHQSLLVVGVLVLVCSLFSVKIEKLSIASKSMIALFTGVLLGPKFLSWFDPDKLSVNFHFPGPFVEGFTQITMAITLMAIALRLPKNYFFNHPRLMSMLILGLMTLMWVSSSLIIHFFLGIPLTVAFLAGAVITPTDPVLSGTLVTGKIAERHIPPRLRNSLSAEAGANDGLAYPFVFLPILLLQSPSEWSGEWLQKVVLYETLGGILLGIFVGIIFGNLVTFSEKRKLMETSSFLSLTLGFTFFALGIGEFCKVNSFLTIFAGGIAFDHLASSSDKAAEENIQESINYFFTIPVFAIFGLYLPWERWLELGWKALLVPVLILFLRRLPFLYFFRKFFPDLSSKKDALFAGWFGPMGVAAFYYSNLAVEKTANHEVWTIASLVIFFSIIFHGITGPLFSERFQNDEEYPRVKSYFTKALSFLKITP